MLSGKKLSALMLVYPNHELSTTMKYYSHLKMALLVAPVLMGGGGSLDALTNAGLIFHFDAAEAVYSDAGVTPASDGDRVYQWGNQAALGGTASALQIEELKRPRLAASAVNGRPAIRFDRGESNLLVIDRETAPEAAPLLDTNVRTWTFVSRSLAPAAGQQWIAGMHFADGNEGYGDLNIIHATNGNVSANMRTKEDALVGIQGGGTFANEWIVMSVVWNGTSGALRLYVNGELRSSTTAAFRDLPAEWQWLVFGNRYTGVRPFEGEIAEFAVYNTELSDADRLANEAELAEKYGLGPHIAMPFRADFGSVRLINILGGLTGAEYEVGGLTEGISPFIDDDLTDQVVPAADGDGVRQWRNQSPLGEEIMALQTHASKRPAYVADALNGHPSVKFDRASGNVLVVEKSVGGSGIGTALDTNTISWTLVKKSDERTAGQQWLVGLHYEGRNAGFGDVNTILASNGNLGSNMRDNNDTLVSSGPNIAFENGEWHIVTMTLNAATGRFVQYIDGVETGSSDNAFLSGPLTWEWIVFGNRYNEIRPWSGEIAEFVMYNAELSDEDRLANERWLDAKYGLGVFESAEPPESLVTANQVLHFDAGAGVMTPDPEGTGGITSLPAELKGNYIIRTSNAQSDWGDDVYLAFEVSRPVTVYIANSPTTEPWWLSQNFGKTTMTVGTTDGSFDIWERNFDAGDYVILPGNGGGPGDHNYWVILSETPDSITPAPDYLLADQNGEWSQGRNYQQLTTDPSGQLHTSGLVTEVTNLNRENGFRIDVNFKVPQLQHEGENAYGLLLFGDLVYQPGGYAVAPDKGIRVEWLPRAAGGGSIFRLVDNATGQVLPGANASVSWQGSTPTRTNDWTAGDAQIGLHFWDSRASEVASYYFADDEEREILRMPDGLDPGFIMEGIRTQNDISNSSASFLDFMVVSGDPADGNPGVTVFVAWDIRASGFEPSWLINDFEKTDYFVRVSSDAEYHRLWAREYPDNSQVVLPGASFGGGPYPEGTDNYFVLLGDARPGLETTYWMEVDGVWEDNAWVLSAALTDGNGYSETVTATVASAFENQNVFGIAVQQPDQVDGGETPVTPIWQTYDFSMNYLMAPVAEGFAGWQEDNFTAEQLADPSISGPDATPAGDGVANLLKYALGFQAFENVTIGSMLETILDPEDRLVMSYIERTAIDDVEYIPEVSYDLVNWEAGTLEEILREPGAEGEENVTVRVTTGGSDRGFMRLRVEQTAN